LAFTIGTRTEAFDLYYDDIVLDTKRVGCVASGDP
jgi:hypothetical protein